MKGDTVLQRIPQVSVRLQANEMVSVEADDRRILLGPHTLAVLDAFSRPATFSEVLRRLEVRTTGAQDWIELTSTIMELYRAGVLRAEEEATLPTALTNFGFDNPRFHVKMLNDRSRTQAYISAIREVVRPGDVVVDLGTGTGVLAVAAAQAGARHVYAIEAGAVAGAARAVFDANGMGDRITLVEGWSTGVTLPEPADVLVTETIGDEPLSEKVLEFTLDSRKRLLKSDARVVPGRVRLAVLPLTIPPEVLVEHTFSPAGAETWKAWYQIDFHPLSNFNPYLCSVKPLLARGWPTFSDPLPVGAWDLSKFESFKIRKQAEFAAIRSGTLNGLLVYAELDLSPMVTLSLHPKEVNAASSWQSSVWIPRRPLDVSRGERFSVSYNYPSRPEDRLAITPL